MNPNFGRGFDSHRPLQKSAKFTLIRLPLLTSQTLDLRPKGWGSPQGFAPKLRPNSHSTDGLETRVSHERTSG
jgi:hypothetical protein